MVRRALSATALLGVLAGTGLTGSPAFQPGAGRIEGRVVDAVSGMAVAEAEGSGLHGVGLLTGWGQICPKVKAL